MMRKRFVLIAAVILGYLPFASAGSQDFPVPEQFRDTSRIPPGDFHKRMMELENAAQHNFIGPLDESTVIRALRSNISPAARVISIIAVGDIMPGTNYPKESYLPPDCHALFDPVRDLIRSADLATGNLEGVFSSGGGIPKTCKDPENCYVFRMPDEYINEIRDAGFDILGTANNHVNDFGEEGRRATAAVLKKAGMHFAGLITDPWTIYDTLGLKIAYCAFSPHTGTLSLTDYTEAARIVAHLDSLCDIVVVGFHGGAEGKDYQHVTREDEEFLGNNRGNVYRFAHTVIDAGADLVIGSGPHVVRAVEFYRDRLIAYSLGNFCTWTRFNLQGPNAFAPMLQVWMNGEGKIVKARIHSFRQNGEGGPVPDPDLNAARRIRELTGEDFPGDDIAIGADGWISSPGTRDAQNVAGGRTSMH